MPRIAYTPEGAETARVFEFEDDDLESGRMVEIEAVLGMSYPAALEQLRKRSITAIRGFLMVLMNDGKPGIESPEQLVFKIKEIDIGPSDAEYAAYLEATPKAKWDDEDKAAAKRLLVGVKKPEDHQSPKAPRTPKSA